MMNKENIKGVERICTQENYSTKIAAGEAENLINSEAESGVSNQLSDSVDQWHYVSA